MVMAWSVDRLGRSLQDLVGFLSELHALHVDLFLHQQGLDTTTPGGKAMFQMMGVFAEFERSMIQERVRAGLRRPPKQGFSGPQRLQIAPALVYGHQEGVKRPKNRISRRSVGVRHLASRGVMHRVVIGDHAFVQRGVGRDGF